MSEAFAQAGELASALPQVGRRQIGRPRRAPAPLLLRAALLAGAMAWAAGGAAAQADSMAQGEASINVRSDMRMSLRGTNGTPRARLQQLTEVVTGKMPAVRSCYRKLVAKRPIAVGAFRVTINLAKGRDTQFAVEERGGSDAELKRCVLRALRKALFRGVERPAAAVVKLEFSNSRADGQAELQRRKAEQDDVAVRVDEGGRATAIWRHSGGKVAFEAHASGPGAKDTVASAILGLRNGFAAFLDCRRRNDKDGLSPAGKIDVQLRLSARGGKASMKLKTCTVPHKRAPRCNERAFRRTKFPPAPPGARADVTITFGD
ncbi:MAG: hypothetical protein OXR73_23150 [Myxococcales bacterium]|nr:hypothetical protein [Myxococcales bacterium]